MRKGLERVGQSDQSITGTTHNYLKGTLENLELRRGTLVGLGTDYTSGLHDDPAVVREMQQLDGSIDKIKLILKNYDVLPTRNNTGHVDVGNRVKIKFEEDGSEEVFRLGTSTDASYLSDEYPWISVESPLGKELKNKRNGDTVSYRLGLQKMNVVILDILNEK